MKAGGNAARPAATALAFACIAYRISSAQDSRFNIQVGKSSACTLDARNRKNYSVQVTFSNRQVRPSALRSPGPRWPRAAAARLSARIALPGIAR